MKDTLNSKAKIIIKINTKTALSFKLNIKIDPDKNKNKCLAFILAIIRTLKLIGRANKLKISIKTKIKLKIVGDLIGVR